MTIDLGFAWLTLPSGREVSIVDVPGHERFIKNMLAGVGGIDAALLVIAADEGPMPQTAEHLAILDLLGIERGLVVLTKPTWWTTTGWRWCARRCASGWPARRWPARRWCRSRRRTGAGLPSCSRRSTALLDTTPPPRRRRPPAPADRPRLHDRRLRHGRHRHAHSTARSRSGRRSRSCRRAGAPASAACRATSARSRSAAPGSRVAVNLAGLAVADLRARRCARPRPAGCDRPTGSTCTCG